MNIIVSLFFSCLLGILAGIIFMFYLINCIDKSHIHFNQLKLKFKYSKRQKGEPIKQRNKMINENLKKLFEKNNILSKKITNKKESFSEINSGYSCIPSEEYISSLRETEEDSFHLLNKKL